MSFNFREYLGVAEFLLTNLDTEASIRSGISRAYYSSLNAATRLCLFERIINNLELRSGDTHKKIIDCLKNHDVREFKSIGKKIESLKIKRVDADYKPFAKDMDRKTLVYVIEMSKEIHATIDELNNN